KRAAAHHHWPRCLARGRSNRVGRSHDRRRLRRGGGRGCHKGFASLRRRHGSPGTSNEVSLMILDVSVILPTHAPHAGRLARALAGLREQTLPRDRWELLIVDNASPDQGIFAAVDLHWHSNARIVREERLGLTHARVAGIRAASGDALVFVDDDNV